MHCDYCYYLRKEDNLKKSKMPFEIAYQMIKSILSYNTHYAKFIWHGGEPLLSGLRMFERIVKEQERLNLKKLVINNTIQTNGLLLHNDWAKFFTKYKFNVGISLDGPYNLCKHRKITRAEFNKILKGIDLLNENNANTGVLTVVSCGFVNYTKDILNFYTENGIKRVKFLPCIVVDKFGCIDESLSIKSEEYGEFLSRFLDTWLESGITNIVFENFDNYIKSKENLPGTFCSQRNGCGHSVTISPNGNIYLCDNFPMTDDNVLGNVKTGFSKLANNSQLKDFMEKIKILPRECIKCKFFDCCGGDCSHRRWLMQQNFKGISYLCNGNKIFFQHFDDIIKSTGIHV